MEYSSHLCAARLQALQLTLRSSATADALVIVPGLDGQYNVGSQAVTKWLLLGHYGRSVDEPTVDPEHEPIEDCVLCVTPNHVSIYMNHTAAQRLQPLISLWPSYSCYVLKEEDKNDVESCELFKIKSFIEMVRGLKRVAVPLTPGWSPDTKRARTESGIDTSKAFEIEQWPLIQAYGLAEMNTGGFFTMVHQVEDFSPALGPLLHRVDHHAARQMVSGPLAAVHKHWHEMCRALELSKDITNRQTLTELDIGDAIINYFDFAMIRRIARGEVVPQERGPRVLLGTHSLDLTQRPDDHSPIEVRAAGIGGRPALHFVAEAEDPETGLRVARTYFLRAPYPLQRKPLPPYLLHALAGTESSASAPAESSDADKEEMQDFERLRSLHGLLLRSVRAAIASLADAAKALTAEACVVAASGAAARVWSFPSARRHLPNGFDLESNLQLTCQWFDDTGRAIPTEALQSTAGFVYVKLSLSNIPSAISSELLGSIVVGDTLLLAPNTAPAECDTADGTGVMIFTRNVSYHQSWCCTDAEANRLQHMRRLLSNKKGRSEDLGIGQIVQSPQHHIWALTGSVMSSTSPVADHRMHCQIRVYSTGIELVHPGYGSIPISMRYDVIRVWTVSGAACADAAGVRLPQHPSRLSAQSKWLQPALGGDDASSASAWEVCVIQLRPGSPAGDFAAEGDGIGYIALLLEPESSSRSAVLESLAAWQTECEFTMQRVRESAENGEQQAAQALALCEREDTMHDDHSLPRILSSAYRQWWYQTWEYRWDTEHILQQFARVQTAAVVQSEQLLSLPPLPAAVQAVRGGVHVVVLLGFAGAGKGDVATCLQTLSPPNVRVAIAGSDAPANWNFSPSECCDDVLSAASNHTQAVDTPSNATAVVVYIAPHGASAPDVCAVLQRYAPHVTVAACAAVLHPSLVFADERASRLLPGLREMLLPGFVTDVVITGGEASDAESKQSIHTLQQLVHDRGVPMHRPVVSVVNGGMGAGVTLSLDRVQHVLSMPFHSEQLTAAREVLHPLWPSHSVPLRSPVADALTVQLSARLDRQRFVQRIERLLSYAQDGPAAVFAHSPAGDLPPPASVRAVFGRVAFTDGTACDVSATCGTFRLTSAADGPQCSLVFVGFELSDAVQAQLHEAVLQARPPLPQPMQHKSRQGLEPTEREAIRSATLSAPLPEGVVFDGQSFVSFSGAVSKFHPHMLQFEEAYVDAFNEAVNAFNSALRDVQQEAQLELQGHAPSAQPWWTRQLEFRAPDVSVLFAALQSAARPTPTPVTLTATSSADESAAMEDHVHSAGASEFKSAV